MYWVLLYLSSGTDLQKSRHVLKSLSLCNKVLSYLLVLVLLVLLLLFFLTPWDNRNGWLGVKHQITYLLALLLCCCCCCLFVSVLALSFFVSIVPSSSSSSSENVFFFLKCVFYYFCMLFSLGRFLYFTIMILLSWLFYILCWAFNKMQIYTLAEMPYVCSLCR